MDWDFDEGKPSKLKTVAISELEEKLAEVVDQLIDGKNKTESCIKNINFGAGSVGDGSVEMTITFSKKHEDLF